MVKYFYMILVCMAATQWLNAQKITGRVQDEHANPVEFASVVLMKEADSSMVAFTNTNRKGDFELNASYKAAYILQISYLGYGTIHQKIELGNADLDLKTIQIQPGAQVLDVIEIHDFAIPMSFGKDTVQYNAAAFNVKPGEMAEDLLRKLPGIEVERDGSVKALGEKVENVLVDGKEFFGKDTKIATKNIDADAIDKVQVFDRRSDRADFTGIDDGQRERSINLKLMEGKKAGYFGTAEASGGTEQRFRARANINRFTPRFRTSFIGMANNINEQNFSMSDYIDFMGGISSFSSGGGGRITLNLDGSDGLPVGLNNNQGIQQSYAGGFNINSDLSKKTSLETSVLGSHFGNNLEQFSTAENLLPDNRFITTSNQQQLSEQTSGSFTLRYKTQIDSTQNLVFKANGSAGFNGLASSELSELFSIEMMTQNHQDNTLERQGNNRKIAGDILWQMKTKKHGRTFSIHSNGNYASQNTSADLHSLYKIYFPQLSENMLVQHQNGLNNGLFFRAEASYTEPLPKKSYLEWNASISNQSNKTSSDYFDIVNENPIRNLLLSNQYQRDYIQRMTGINYILSREKFNLTIGSSYKYSSLNGQINDDENRVRNHYQAILPNAWFTFRFGMSEHLNFNYFSELNEPALEQLRPTVNNSNPLAVYTGNPGLKPEQMHLANVSFMRYSAFDFTLIYFSLQTNYTTDKITDAMTIDTTLTRYYTPVNVKYESTTSGRLEYETPVRPLKIKTRAVLKASYNRGFSVINELSNPVNRYGYGYNFSVENRNKEVIDVSVGYKFNHNQSLYGADQSMDQSWSENTWFATLGLNIRDWVDIKSDFEYTGYQSSLSTETKAFPLWSGSITAFLTKDKKLRMTLSCFDILNRNEGINTVSRLNYTEVSQTNVLHRYFMLGLSYNLKGFRKKSGIEVSITGKD